MISVKEIDACLPQTQCGECDFDGCRPYAEAMAQGQATIDRCPPGGIETLRSLGQVLSIDPTPFIKQVKDNTRPPSTAIIREEECIGCTKCIQACPVDAIVGSAKTMHSILEQECTGCGLCVEPCPVDCIDMVELEEPAYDKALARDRHLAREVRLLKATQDKQRVYREKRQLVAKTEDKEKDKIAKTDFIKEALARVHAKKSQLG
jgi:Na+-translocating ferredoxin:NAD+ oxidoreductase subunit B